MWTLLKIAGVIGLCYGAVALLMFLSQRRLLYYPVDRLAATPAEAGLEYEDVWLTTGQGTRIHAWWLPHDNPRLTLLFAHGNGGNISHRLDSLRIFHDLGLSVLIFDYSGYGQSQGSPTEEAIMADARAAWEWLTHEQSVAPESVVLFGRSLGGGVVAGLAGELAAKQSAENVRPAGIILESTFTSVPDMGQHLYPWLPVRWLARDRFDSVRALDGVCLPALFLHSPLDEIVPFELGRSLYETYEGPKTFVELTGGHNDGFLLTGEPYFHALDRFLATLPGGGRP